jgi:hypothetical protein
MSNTKVTIQGVPPQFDETELRERQAGYHHMYMNTLQCMELVTAGIPYDFLNKVIEKSKQGYTLAEKNIITTLPLDYSVYMVKPIEIQDADQLLIDAKVKAEYVDYLQAEHLRYQELLRQQLIQAAEAKERKKADDAEAKRLASIEAEVAATFTKLVIPD